MTTIAIDVGNVTLDELLARVERGESLALLRGGRRVATLRPEQEELSPEAQERGRRAAARMEELRQKLVAEGRASTDAEIIAMRNEGRR